MKLIKEAWDESEFDFEEEETFEEPIEPIESEVKDEIQDEVQVEVTPAIVNTDTTDPVEVKTTTTTSVEVKDNFTDVREEMARDTYNQFKSGNLSVLDLNKRLAALCGSYEAAMDWLVNHESSAVAEPTEEIETVEIVTESLNEDITMVDHVEIEDENGVEKRKEEVDTVPKEVKPEEDKSEEEKVEEIPDMPKAGIENYIANELNSNIVGEWDTIKKYNDFVATLESNEDAKPYATIINVIKDINNEEHKHIAQLQQALKLVSPNAVSLEAGQVEGSEQLATPVEIDGKEIQPSENTLEKNTLYGPEEAEKEEKE